MDIARDHRAVRALVVAGDLCGAPGAWRPRFAWMAFRPPPPPRRLRPPQRLPRPRRHRHRRGPARSRSSAAPSGRRYAACCASWAGSCPIGTWRRRGRSCSRRATRAGSARSTSTAFGCWPFCCFGGLIFFLSLQQPVAAPGAAQCAVGLRVWASCCPSTGCGPRSGSRKNKILRALPDALDMLTIGVEAGLAFESAMIRVGEKWDNALTREFQRAVAEMRVGMSREDALTRMAERCGVPELSTFVAVLVQSSQLGVSIAQVLHTQAERDAPEAAAAGRGTGPPGGHQDDHPAGAVRAAGAVYGHPGPDRSRAAGRVQCCWRTSLGGAPVRQRRECDELRYEDARMEADFATPGSRPGRSALR